jgi:hypothetical protein
MTGLEWPHRLEITIDGARIFEAPVGGEEDNAMSDANFSAAADAIDARLRTRVFVEAGPHDVGVTFVRRNSAESHEPLELHTRDLDLQNMNGLPIVDYLSLTGPYDATGSGTTPSRQQIFSCRPPTSADEQRCAEEILSNLARRAYRGPIGEEELSLLLDFYARGRAAGGFETGIRSALRTILTSPQFLFRREVDPADLAPGTLYPVDDVALASRLSFFLWSSLPDEQLLDLAEQQGLSDPVVYEQQVRRMRNPAADKIIRQSETAAPTGRFPTRPIRIKRRRPAAAAPFPPRRSGVKAGTHRGTPAPRLRPASCASHRRRSLPRKATLSRPDKCSTRARPSPAVRRASPC